MSPRPQRLYGVPRMFDTFLKPLARRGALLLGMLCIPVLVWLELWMWVPIPLLALVLLNEFVWWLRGDRAIVVQLSRDSLVVVDRKGQDELSLAVADIQAVNVWYRSRGRWWHRWLHCRGYDGAIAGDERGRVATLCRRRRAVAATRAVAGRWGLQGAHGGVRVLGILVCISSGGGSGTV